MPIGSAFGSHAISGHYVRKVVDIVRKYRYDQYLFKNKVIFLTSEDHILMVGRLIP